MTTTDDQLAIPDTTTPRKKPTEPAATESEMLDLLERHYARAGNGGSGEYAFMRQVRSAAGFDARRTFDAVVVGLWPSRGHDIHVIEVKVSRSDWLRELAKPDKAEDASKVADRFSVAAPRGVVDIAELPATWGYIEVSGGVEEFQERPPAWEGGSPCRVRTVTGRKVRAVRAAPLLRPPEECRGPIPRTFLVPMLRAAGAVPAAVPHQQALTNQACAKAVAEARAAWEESRASEEQRQDEKAERFEREWHIIRDGCGRRWRDEDGLREMVAKWRRLSESDNSVERARAVLSMVRTDLERQVQYVARQVEWLDSQAAEQTKDAT